MPHHERPHEIELLLHRQRPKMWQPERRRSQRMRPIQEEDPEPQLITIEEMIPQRPSEQWHNEERKNQRQIVRREDAQNPPGKKRPKVIRCALGLEQISRNEKSR